MDYATLLEVYPDAAKAWKQQYPCEPVEDTYWVDGEDGLAAHDCAHQNTRSPAYWDGAAWQEVD
jgi:hypothetical protein